MKPSILKRILGSFLVFGLVMGVVFIGFTKVVLPDAILTHWFITGCIVAGVVMGVANFFILHLILVSKLQEISNVANAISSKDLTFSCTIKSNDVIGIIIDSFNGMTVNLRNLIEELRVSARSMVVSVEEMTAAASETEDRVKRQHAETDQVAQAMNQMTAAVQDVARNAEKAASAALSSKGEADNGRQVVNNTISSINSLAGEVETAASVIKKLEQESDNIGSVLDVIRGIAEQTNLLALNAAIEAARAGEQGRGFAVVADEVRTLAQRTQQSTQEIQQMIEKLQAGSRDAVKVMERGQSQAAESVEQAAKAGQSLSEITEAVAAISNMNAQIAEAAEQQGAVAEGINRSIVNMSEIANSSSHASQRSAHASSELMELADQLQTAVVDYKTA